MPDIAMYNEKLVEWMNGSCGIFLCSNLWCNEMEIIHQPSYYHILEKMYNKHGKKLFHFLDILFQLDPKSRGFASGYYGYFSTLAGYIDYLLTMEGDFRDYEKGNFEFMNEICRKWFCSKKKWNIITLFLFDTLVHLEPDFDA